MVKGLLILSVAVLSGCGAAKPIQASSVQKELIGKTLPELTTCAGQPVEATRIREGLVVKYYREAPMFEESTVFSKARREPTW